MQATGNERKLVVLHGCIRYWIHAYYSTFHNDSEYDNCSMCNKASVQSNKAVLNVLSSVQSNEAILNVLSGMKK